MEKLSSSSADNKSFRNHLEKALKLEEDATLLSGETHSGESRATTFLRSSLSPQAIHPAPPALRQGALLAGPSRHRPRGRHRCRCPESTRMRTACTVIAPPHTLEVVLSRHTQPAPPSPSPPLVPAKASAEARPHRLRGCRRCRSALPKLPGRAAVLPPRTLPPSPSAPPAVESAKLRQLRRRSSVWCTDLPRHPDDPRLGDSAKTSASRLGDSGDSALTLGRVVARD